MTLAIHAITQQGSGLADRLQAALPSAQTFSLYPSETSAAVKIDGAFKAHFGEHFNHFSVHLCICSVGIMTRILASLATNKREDPAVICMDEQGQFVVPVLSGHRGGANAWALRIAETIGAQSVITTASDSSGAVAMDLLGAAFGWQLDPECESEITAVSAAVVNDKPMLVTQDSGHSRWWPHQKIWPENWSRTDPKDAQARLVISHKTDLKPFAGPSVIWRPTVLDLGLGCDRNTPQQVIAEAVTAFCQQHQLSPLAIRSLNSIDLKADEVGLIDYAKTKALPFKCFSKQQLADVKGIENPSATVERCIGVSSVAEASALFSSGCKKLLAPKFKYKSQGFNVTVAACLGEPVTKVVLKKAKQMKGYCFHLILCGGRHCANGTMDTDDIKKFASKLRRLSAIELPEEYRVKITRSQCIGGCRTGVRAVLYRHDQQQDPNHGFWLQNLEQIPFDQWRQLFQALKDKQSWHSILDPEYIAQVACQGDVSA